MCPIFPCVGAGALTHCDGSLPTPHTIYACVNVLGAFCTGFCCAIVPGVGWTIRECNEDVRFGITKLSSSRLIGRDSPERGREVKEGAMSSVVTVSIV